MTCPYCRTTGRTRDLLLSCVPGCGSTVPFPVAGLRRGRCPHGRTPQARRSCPKCLRDLPREYVDNAGRTIAVIGPKSAGKSTWVAAVIGQLGKGEMPQRFPGMSVDLLGEDSRVRYRRDFEPLLAGRAVVGAAGEPLLLSLRLPASPVVVTLYDTAGEDFSTTRAKGLAPHLGAASGILLVLDPTRAPDVGPLLGATDGVVAASSLIGVLRRISRPARTPLAVVMSKVDLVWEMFDERAPTRLPSAHAGHYAESDGLDVHHEVHAWLNRWYGPGLVRDIAANFPVHRYFGLSALGAGACPPAYRVEDPMLWLLAHFGAIRTWRGRR